MKKLLLIIFFAASAIANIVYDTESSMYYSTSADKSFNVNEYHELATNVNILIHEAIRGNMPIAMMIDEIMDALISNGSYEALVLYDDLSILWGL
jgi:hypothetical protein